MKRLLVVLLCGLMMLAGCAASGPKTKMTPGTYTSVGTGFKGDIKVDVTVTEDAITDVKVVETHETAGIGGQALDVLVANVLKHQTIGVDSVSGATITSAGFKMAVKDALTQAGADMDYYTAAPAKAKLVAETIETDVVVVGGGASGMMSALYLAKEGYKVTLLEKTAMTGGASAMAGGGLALTNSQVQKDLGYEDSSEALKQRLLNAGHGKNHLPTVDIYTSIIGPNADWIVSKDGGEMDYPLTGTGASLSYPTSGNGAMLTLKKNMLNAGVDLLLSTKADELIVTDGVVTGVKATGEEKAYTINAKAVILATGGYGHNNEIVPEEYFAFRYSGHSGHDGDALEMIKAVDGATRNLTWLNKQPNTMMLPSGVPQYTNMGVSFAYKNSGILINQDGERFALESGKDWELMEAMAQNETQYLLMDQTNFDGFNNGMSSRGIFNAEDPAKWTADDYNGLPFYKGADTLEELAAKINVPADALQATVDKYNAAVVNGTEDEFGRTLTTTIDTSGRMYALEMSIRYSTSLGGICINDNMQVLNNSDAPVEGLYAVGEVVGGIQGDLYLGGSTFSWAMVSGVEGGRQVAEVLGK